MMPGTAIQMLWNPSAWLLDDPEGATQNTEAAIAAPIQASSSTILAQLGRVAKASLARQIVDALQQIVPDDLVEVCRSAWGDYQKLRDVGAETARQTPIERVVLLTEPKVSFAQQATFAVLVKGQQVLSVKGQAEVVLSLTNSEAVVRAGRLIRVHAGRAAVTGAILVEEQQIVHKELPWPHEFHIEFNPGVDLTQAAARLATGTIDTAR